MTSSTALKLPKKINDPVETAKEHGWRVDTNVEWPTSQGEAGFGNLFVTFTHPDADSVPQDYARKVRLNFHIDSDAGTPTRKFSINSVYVTAKNRFGQTREVERKLSAVVGILSGHTSPINLIAEARKTEAAEAKKRLAEIKFEDREIPAFEAEVTRRLEAAAASHDAVVTNNWNDIGNAQSNAYNKHYAALCRETLGLVGNYHSGDGRCFDVFDVLAYKTGYYIGNIVDAASRDDQGGYHPRRLEEMAQRQAEASWAKDFGLMKLYSIDDETRARMLTIFGQTIASRAY